MSLNKVMLLGRLGGDVELKYTPTGTAVANFSVATSERWKDKAGQQQEKVEWHRIVIWGKLGELCNQYLHKGSQVLLEGKNLTRVWEDKDGKKMYTTEVVCNNAQFVDPPPTQQGQSPQGPAQQYGQPQGQQAFDQNFAADDIPF